MQAFSPPQVAIYVQSARLSLARISSCARTKGSAFFCAPLLPQRRDLLFYCSYTPQKVIWELYYIGGVFFGASSFGRFGRRGKTPNLSQGVFTDTPCVTLSHQESVGASPLALERNHQPCSLMRRRSWRGSRVVRGSPQR